MQPPTTHRSTWLALFGLVLLGFGGLFIFLNAVWLAVVFATPGTICFGASLKLSQREQQRGEWQPKFSPWGTALVVWLLGAFLVYRASPWYEQLSTPQVLGLVAIWLLPVPFLCVLALRE
jgi:hypothetical protein